MQTDEQIRYFLGTYSPQGFYSLYDQAIDPAGAAAVYILKGGPNCGSGAFLRQTARLAQEAGEAVECVQCPGDPDALDAVLLPGRRAAVVDGAPPHVVEAVCPGAVEHYVNIEACCDREGLGAVRREIVDGTAQVRDCCKRACRCLTAAEEIGEDMRLILTTEGLEEKCAKRARAVLSREIRRPGNGAGQVAQRFLGAFTPMGAVCYYGTANVLCKRIYTLEDSRGLSHLLLAHLLGGATAAGYDVTACPSPMAPDRLEHLLIPELSLAFLTAPPGLAQEKRPCRKIRVDAMVDAEVLRRNKARLRFSRKVTAALLEEAAASLAQAKAARDGLKELYRPHVDFGRVERMAEELAGELLKPESP